jgi:hypothetical protein
VRCRTKVCFMFFLLVFLFRDNVLVVSFGLQHTVDIALHTLRILKRTICSNNGPVRWCDICLFPLHAIHIDSCSPHHCARFKLFRHSHTRQRNVKSASVDVLKAYPFFSCLLPQRPKWSIESYFSSVPVNTHYLIQCLLYVNYGQL